jgi:hypothetical protein
MNLHRLNRLTAVEQLSQSLQSVSQTGTIPGGHKDMLRPHTKGIFLRRKARLFPAEIPSHISQMPAPQHMREKLATRSPLREQFLWQRDNQQRGKRAARISMNEMTPAKNPDSSGPRQEQF